MNAFAADIRALLADRLARASASDVLALASALCANEDRVGAPTPGPPRFTKLGAAGRAVPDSATDWVAVYDSRENLTWTRSVLDCGEVDHADALKSARAVRLFGATDWDAPTIQQQLSIIDYERFDPAIDTTYFDGPTGWCWTKTLAKSPSECAWFVGLDAGYSGRGHRSVHARVRAVRAGQQLGLGV